MYQLKREIFVFGSNLAGRHGSGAARDAYEKYGAKYGVGEGLTGDSYALPTKDRDIQTLPLNRIRTHVQTFLDFARLNPHLTFMTTAVGCGLAGYTPKDIAPMFAGRPENVKLPSSFIDILYPMNHNLDNIVEMTSFNW